jgi:hypothetical protein
VKKIVLALIIVTIIAAGAFVAGCGNGEDASQGNGGDGGSGIGKAQALVFTQPG